MGPKCGSCAAEATNLDVKKSRKDKKKQQNNRASMLQNMTDPPKTMASKLEQEINASMNMPELGIYDTRAWDAAYQQHMTQNGPNPGLHPDPECIWNKVPKEYDEAEYKMERDGLIQEARENKWI